MRPIAPRLRPRPPRICGALLVCSVLTGRAGGAGAQPMAGPVTPSVGLRSHPGEPALLGLILKTDSPLLNDGPLAEALSRELGVVVLPREILGTRRPTGLISVSWRPTRGELVVSYDEGDRGVVSRVVRAPAEAPAALELAVSLAGNLARDQVGELLGTTEPLPWPPAAAAPAVLAAAPLPIVMASPYRHPLAPVPAATPARARIPITLALFYPWSTYQDQPGVSTRLHFNLIYGRVGELQGLALGSWSAVDGPVHGVQIGLVGGSAETVVGAQLGLVTTETRSDLTGLQVAGAMTHSGGDLRGVQASFGLNASDGGLNGLQVGSVNFVEGSVHGAQVGLVNLARGQVKGLQIGLVNVADDMQGLPLGLVNVSRTGSIAGILWFSTLTEVNAGIRFSNGDTYSILGAALATASPSWGGTLHFIGPGLAIGQRFPLTSSLTAASDVGVGLLSSAPHCCATTSELWDRYLVLPRWRGSLGLDLAPGVKPFVGMGIALKVLREYGNTTSNHLMPEVFAGLAL